jgi:hypothetical protein
VQEITGIAVGISLFAGLSTSIGGLIVLLLKKINGKILSVALGFSAGVMIYVSFLEILPEAKSHLIKGLGSRPGEWVAYFSFLLGIFLIGIIDKFVPENENPHEPHNMDQLDSCEFRNESAKLIKTGKMAAVAITIHNFPEGLATFMSSINNLSLGIVIAVAVAIHNIPEGINRSSESYNFLPEVMNRPDGNILNLEYQFIFKQFYPVFKTFDNSEVPVNNTVEQTVHQVVSPHFSNPADVIPDPVPEQIEYIIFILLESEECISQ